MPGDRREQVFVSSTYLDLREERQSVIQALLIAGCIPAGMELFPAGNDEKWRLIQRVIAECDYYLLVIGGKYGSVDPDTEVSYTEMEFDYAESIGKPIMAFLHGEPGQLKGAQLELEKEPREKLDAFRAKVEASRVVKYWTTPSELPGHVALALMETREHFPAEGWIRASQAMTPEVRTELAELRARVAELTRQAESSTPDPPKDLAQGEDVYKLEVRIPGYAKDQIDDNGSPHSWEERPRIWIVRPGVTWNAILQALGPGLLHEASEVEVRKIVFEWITTMGPEIAKLLPEKFGRQKGAAELGPKVVDDILVQLFALGLISRGQKKRTVSDKGKYWALTGYGEDLLMKLRAFRRSDV